MMIDLHFEIAVILLAAVIVATKSDVFRRIESIVKRREMKSAGQFADSLLLLPGGFFIHKLWTCYVCQSVHIAWISALVAAVTTPFHFGLLEVAFGTAAMFCLSYVILGIGSTAPSVTARPQVEDEEDQEEWPEPIKPYASRITTQLGESNRVTVTGVDELARRALAFVSQGGPCDFPRCEELRKAFEEEEQAELEAGCTECQKGEVRRKYINRAIALLGG